MVLMDTKYVCFQLLHQYFLATTAAQEIIKSVHPPIHWYATYFAKKLSLIKTYLDEVPDVLVMFDCWVTRWQFKCQVPDNIQSY